MIKPRPDGKLYLLPAPPDPDPSTSSGFILLENGSKILLETSGDLIKEWI